MKNVIYYSLSCSGCSLRRIASLTKWLTDNGYKIIQKQTGNNQINFNELLNSGLKTYKHVMQIVNGERILTKVEIPNLTRNTSYESFFYFEDSKKTVLVKEAQANGNSFAGLI